MGTPTNYIAFGSTGAATAIGYTPDGTLPAGAVACTLAQFQAAQAVPLASVTLAAGAIVVGAAPALSAAQVAKAAYAAFLAGGLTVTSTGTPALSGVYPIDPASQVDIATEAQFISTFAEFTNGTTANLQWALANGNPVTFPTTAAFLGFAKVAAQTVAAAKLALAQLATMPAATVTIA